MSGYVNRANQWLLEFLAAPEYRWTRHLLLAALSLTLALSTVFRETMSPFISRMMFFCAFLLPIYCNVFFFTPRLLLRNRTGWYVVCSVLATLYAVALAFCAQLLAGRTLPAENESERIYSTLINACSAMISIMLIVAGTSAVMLVQQKIRNARRIEELENAAIRSELEQLKNQINPHFLFNMLNNANVLVGENPAEATTVLRKLKEMLSYQFDESRKDQVLLSDEIAFMGDYIKLESIRRDRFNYIVLDMDCPTQTCLPPLLFIPFVENAMKHGNSRSESYVMLVFMVKENKLDFMCTNSKPSIARTDEGGGGLGLTNIRRRLDLLYPNAHRLLIDQTDKTYTVQLHIDL